MPVVTCPTCGGSVALPPTWVQPDYICPHCRNTAAVPAPPAVVDFATLTDDEPDPEPSPRRSAAGLGRCPDCGRRVSRRARTCPGCACPIRAQTIEQTGKTWKAIQLLGALASALGVVATCGGFGGGAKGRPEEASMAAAMGVLAILFGLLLFMVGRVGAWWYHG